MSFEQVLQLSLSDVIACAFNAVDAVAAAVKDEQLKIRAQTTLLAMLNDIKDDSSVRSVLERCMPKLKPGLEAKGFRHNFGYMLLLKAGIKPVKPSNIQELFGAPAKDSSRTLGSNSLDSVSVTNTTVLSILIENHARRLFSCLDEFPDFAPTKGILGAINKKGTFNKAIANSETQLADAIRRSSQSPTAQQVNEGWQMVQCWQGFHVLVKAYLALPKVANKAYDEYNATINLESWPDAMFAPKPKPKNATLLELLFMSPESITAAKDLRVFVDLPQCNHEVGSAVINHIYPEAAPDNELKPDFSKPISLEAEARFKLSRGIEPVTNRQRALLGMRI